MNALMRHAVESVTVVISSHRDVVPLAIAASLILATMAVSFWSLARAAAWRRADRRSAQATEERYQANLSGLRETVAGLAAELEQARVAAASGYAAARPGMNLSKRSQVLRMHRRGDPPDQIAMSLAIPRQEVDLLLKVHRIVLGVRA